MENVKTFIAENKFTICTYVGAAVGTALYLVAGHKYCKWLGRYIAKEVTKGL